MFTLAGGALTLCPRVDLFQTQSSSSSVADLYSPTSIRNLSLSTVGVFGGPDSEILQVVNDSFLRIVVSGADSDLDKNVRDWLKESYLAKDFSTKDVGLGGVDDGSKDPKEVLEGDENGDENGSDDSKEPKEGHEKGGSNSKEASIVYMNLALQFSNLAWLLRPMIGPKEKGDPTETPVLPENEVEKLLLEVKEVQKRRGSVGEGMVVDRRNSNVGDFFSPSAISRMSLSTKGHARAGSSSRS